MATKIVSRYDAPIISADLNEKFRELFRSATKVNWVISGGKPIVTSEITSTTLVTLRLNGSPGSPVKCFINGAYSYIDNNTDVTLGFSSSVTNQNLYLVYNHTTEDDSQRLLLFVGLLTTVPDNYLNLGTISINIATGSVTFVEDPALYGGGLLKPPTETYNGSDLYFLVYDPTTQTIKWSLFNGQSFAPYSIMTIDDGDTPAGNTVMRARIANAVKDLGVLTNMIANSAVSNDKILSGTISFEKFSPTNRVIRHASITGVRIFSGAADPGAQSVNGDVWLKY